jgi:hypothetical protein
MSERKSVNQNKSAPYEYVLLSVQFFGSPRIEAKGIDYSRGKSDVTNYHEASLPSLAFRCRFGCLFHGRKSIHPQSKGT